MNKYRQIFQNPYIPQYTPMPLSEIGQAMRYRSQMEQRQSELQRREDLAEEERERQEAALLKNQQQEAILSDLQSFGTYQAVSSSLNPSEKNALDQALIKPLQEVLDRIESGNYSDTDDVDFAAKKNALQMANTLGLATNLINAKREDVENFYSRNKKADPRQVEQYASRYTPSLGINEDGVLTLTGGLGNINLPDYVPPEEPPDLSFLEPMTFKRETPEISTTLGRRRTYRTVEDSINALPKEDKEVVSRIYSKMGPDILSSSDEKKKAQALNMVVSDYYDKANQIEGATFEKYTPEQSAEMSDDLFNKNAAAGYNVTTLNDGENMTYGDFLNKYTIQPETLTIDGKINNDITGYYTRSGKGYVGEFYDTVLKETIQFVLDPEIADLNRIEITDTMRTLSDPHNFDTVNITRPNADDELVYLSINKNLKYYLDGEEIEYWRPNSIPVITYSVSDQKGNKAEYTSLNDLYDQIVNRQ